MTQWTYDTLAKGQLTSTSRFAGAVTYTSAVGSYDDYYRPLSTSDTIPGFGTSGGTLTYTVANIYKPNGAAAARAFPAVGGLPAETITHSYHSSTGLPDAVTSNANGTSTYVASTSYFYDGLPDTAILGGTGKRIKQTSTFDAATRRLTNSATATETATVGTYSTKLSDSYAYDNAGNIKSIAGQTNAVADQQECFSYDHLQRLTEAWTQTSGACTTPQRTGADPYRRQWPTSGGYDKLGNRLKQIDKDSTDTTWNYTIGGVDSCGGTSKPHAVTSITATGPKAGTPTRSFCYDQAGNTTKRTTDTGIVQTLTWDKEGHLATLADGTLTTSYIYDSAGRRLIAKNANKSTLYLADGTELEKIGTANPLGQRYYGAAVRDASGLKWIISNHQGTGTAQIDSVTLTLNRRRSMPFGETRGTQPTWLGSKGYVGGTKDDTGPTHLGAREYDPTTGRFISVDPLFVVDDPRQHNPYQYAVNSPLSNSDPSGLTNCGDDYCSGSGSGIGRTKDDDVVVGSGGGKGYAWIVTHSVGDGTTVNGIPVPGGGPSSDEVLAKLEETCAKSEALCVAAFECAYDDPAQCVEMWQQNVNSLYKNMFANEYGDSYDDKLYGPLDQQLVGGLTDVGIAIGAAVIALRGMGGAPAGPNVWQDRLGKPGCGGNSFDPETPVLMADGTTKKIKDVEIGDKVLATDPETGRTEAREITHLIVGEGDKELVDVTIQTSAGPKAIISTAQHPFWVSTHHRWIYATDLQPGMTVLTPGGSEVAVTAVNRYSLHKKVHNLTVASLHTYYVLAGNTPVLVHNTGPFCGTPFGKNTPGDADFHSTGYSLDEMTQFTYGHTGAGNPAMGRPSLGQIETTLRNAGPVRIDGQNAARFDYNGTRVILNYDTPWKSTAYFPGSGG